MLTFVEATQDDRGKGDGPDPVVDFFEGHGFAGERGRRTSAPAPHSVSSARLPNGVLPQSAALPPTASVRFMRILYKLFLGSALAMASLPVTGASGMLG